MVYLLLSLGVPLALTTLRQVVRWGQKQTNRRPFLCYGLTASISLIVIGCTAPATTAAPPVASDQQNHIDSASSSNLTNSSSLTSSMNSPTATTNLNNSAVASTTLNNQCRANVLAGVYHSFRFQIYNPCKTVSGTIYSIRHEDDSDYHINLKLDPQYQNLMNDKNVSREHGCLVVEVIPMDANKIPIPRVGDHVTVTGAYVLDKDHGWNEIHPAWLINGKGSASYTQAEADRSVQIALSHGGDTEEGGGSSQPSPTAPPNGSTSNGSIKVVSTNLDVNPGDYASVTIHVTPGATGNIAVYYSSGKSSSSSLVPKAADSSGNITWKWVVGTRTTPGDWKVEISVGSNSLNLTLHVR